jgi:hypothetical protein
MYPPRLGQPHGHFNKNLSLEWDAWGIRSESTPCPSAPQPPPVVDGFVDLLILAYALKKVLQGLGGGGVEGEGAPLTAADPLITAVPAAFQSLSKAGARAEGASHDAAGAPRGPKGAREAQVQRGDGRPWPARLLPAGLSHAQALSLARRR